MICEDSFEDKSYLYPGYHQNTCWLNTAACFHRAQQGLFFRTPLQSLPTTRLAGLLAVPGVNRSRASECCSLVVYCSLEFFQVRQAAANLNAFQRSLHRLGDGSATFQHSIDVHEQLASACGIEPQITESLESLFKISTEDLIGEEFRSLLQTE